MDDRQKLEQMVNEINMYQNQLDVLNQQMETVKASVSVLSSAEETLNSIKGKKGSETFVPIGAGSFIITELKDTDKVIVGLGAGAAVKKDIDGAKEDISSQKKELEELMAKMNGDIQKLTDFIVRKSPEAEALLRKLEKEEAEQQ